MPRVSIVLPTFNRAALIGRAIESVLAQTVDDWQLVVVDDGSTDDTATVVASFDDPRIEYVRRPNGGELLEHGRNLLRTGRRAAARWWFVRSWLDHPAKVRRLLLLVRPPRV